MSEQEKERIEKASIEYEDKNPYDALHSAYYIGAMSERNKAIDAAIERANFLHDDGRLYIEHLVEELEALKK